MYTYIIRDVYMHILFRDLPVKNKISLEQNKTNRGS